MAKVTKDNNYIMIQVPDRDIKSMTRFIAHAFIANQVENENKIVDLMHSIVFGDLTKQDEFVNKLPTIMAKSKIYNAAMGREPVHDIASYKWYKSTYNPDNWDKHMLVGRYSEYFYRNVINSAEGQRWHKNYTNTITAMIRDHTEDWNTDPFGNICPPEWSRKGFLSKFHCLTDGKTYDSTDVGYVSS